MKYFLLLITFFLIQKSFSFTLISTSNSNQQGWANSNITFAINATNCPAGVDITGLVNSAISTWNNVPTSKLNLSVSGTTALTSAASPVTVYCETNFQTVTGADQNFVPAAAGPSISGNTPVAGILYLNVSAGTARISNFNQNTLILIMAHEIGHVLGLGHSQDTNALMYFDASAKTTLGLAQDDIDGITYLYPRNEMNGEKPFGCGLVKNLPPPPSSGLKLFILLCMFMPLAAAVKLRTSYRKKEI